MSGHQPSLFLQAENAEQRARNTEHAIRQQGTGKGSEEFLLAELWLAAAVRWETALSHESVGNRRQIIEERRAACMTTGYRYRDALLQRLWQEEQRHCTDCGHEY